LWGRQALICERNTEGTRIEGNQSAGFVNEAPREGGTGI
jgi:hypothetical protein